MCLSHIPSHNNCSGGALRNPLAGTGICRPSNFWEDFSSMLILISNKAPEMRYEAKLKVRNPEVRITDNEHHNLFWM